jgi:hypothetical protein
LANKRDGGAKKKDAGHVRRVRYGRLRGLLLMDRGIVLGVYGVVRHVVPGEVVVVMVVCVVVLLGICLGGMLEWMGILEGMDSD